MVIVPITTTVKIGLNGQKHQLQAENVHQTILPGLIGKARATKPKEPVDA